MIAVDVARDVRRYVVRYQIVRYEHDGFGGAVARLEDPHLLPLHAYDAADAVTQFKVRAEARGLEIQILAVGPDGAPEDE